MTVAARSRRRWPRRVALVALVLVLLGVLGFRPVLHRFVGASRHEPTDYPALVSAATRRLVDERLKDLDPARLFDHHVHLAGMGTEESGCRVNAKMLSWRHPRHRAQFLAYLDAARVSDVSRADAQFVERLTALVDGVPARGRYLVLAFDAHHDGDGRVVEDETEMFVPNTWARRVAAARPDVFVAAASVHPWRADAVAELEQAHAAGARIVKWLPNAQGIDPADPRCDAFYDALRRLGMTLLSHAGEERAVDAAGAQEWGNPLRLRRALDHGVRVIVAHCASDGHALDLDDPARPEVETFDLFLRLMDDPRYVGLVYGEISALTMSTRCGRPLETMLARTDLHARLVNGSDYPLPAINVLFRTSQLRELGYLTRDEERALDELYDVNPLLFDLVTKRCLRHPRTGARFPESVFYALP